MARLSPFIARSTAWGASVGLAAGLLVAIEKIWAHGYLSHGLETLSLEVARATVYQYVLPIMMGTAIVAGAFAAVPAVRGLRGVVLWFTPWVLLLPLVGRADPDRASIRPVARAIRDALMGSLGLGRPLANMILLVGLGALGLLVAFLAYRVGRWGLGRGNWQRFSGPGRAAICILGVAGLIAAGTVEVGLARTRARPEPPGPNVVLISVDTLRADHLGSYGHSPSPSPRLDHLAANGLRFEHAVSQAPWTMPAMATVLTSLYPSQHRANSAKSRLSRETDTLAEVLRNAGYNTAAVVSHVFVDERHGFAQGFAEFDEQHILGHGGISSQLLTPTALALLEPQRKEPFFLWVHYFDPHYTYVRHPQYALAADGNERFGDEVRTAELEETEEELSEEDLAYVRAVYDEEIAYTDEWIGRLMDGIEALDPDRPVVYLVSADHGEYFGERDSFGHGKDVYGELVDTPLIIGGDIAEDLRGQVVTTTVENAQIPATVLALAGLEHASFRGRDLLSVARSVDEGFPCFTEGSQAWGAKDRKLAVVYDGWKLIRRLDDRGLELYRLTDDPDEKANLIESQDAEISEVRERYLAQLDRFEHDLKPGSAAAAAEDGLVLDDDEVEHLRSLGYVE